MKELFEIAYAATSNRLCLFTGTGFSKAITDEDNGAPSWQTLLEKICEVIPQSEKVKNALFPKGKNRPLTLEESAQIISLELLKHGKSIHTEIADYIKRIDQPKDCPEIEGFFSIPDISLKIVTTNYDKLIEKLAGELDCHSLTPGLPIPRSDARIDVYHIHGSIDSPENMVITSDDYFKFINEESYFSRKLSTVLHENMIVILGYSLSDTNLKAIISRYRGFSRTHLIGSNIFLVSREKVNPYVKDYYAHCYGIRVLDNLEIRDFLGPLRQKIDEIKNNTMNADKKIKDIVKDVVDGGKEFDDEYLKMEISFIEILSSLSALGRSFNDAKVANMIKDILDIKITHTRDSGAWNQYEYLANWLIHLSSIFELRGTMVEEAFLDAVSVSMEKMSKCYSLGSSWNAYKIWKNRWPTIMTSNRILIRQYIEDNVDSEDAKEIVSYG